MCSLNDLKMPFTQTGAPFTQTSVYGKEPVAFPDVAACQIVILHEAHHLIVPENFQDLETGKRDEPS